MTPVRLEPTASLSRVKQSRMENSMDPDQLASEKPADQDLHCFQTRIYMGFAR